MVHPLRITACRLMFGMILVSLSAYAVESGVSVSEDFQSRHASLADQLVDLQTPMSSESDLPVSVLVRPDTKVGHLASSLDGLILEQQAGDRLDEKSQTPRLLSVEAPEVLLPPMQETTRFMAMDPQEAMARGLPLDTFEAENVDAAEDSVTTDDPVEIDFPEDDFGTDLDDTGAGDTAAGTAVDMDDDEDYEPLPPAPRVQSTQETRAANAALISQLQSLKEEEGGEVQALNMDSSTPETAVQAAAAPQSSPSAQEERPKRSLGENPLDQLVSLDFRDTDLTHIVTILALRADINIVAGSDLRGSVTANLQQVPLRLAMETVLRMNGLGMVEEDGIYFIVPYEEAASVNRKTTMVTLENAKVEEVKKTLDGMVKGVRDEALISLALNKTTNTIIVSAPKNRVEELVTMIHQMDVAEPVLPTVTKAIALNYCEPDQLEPLVKSMLTKGLGSVASDKRAMHLVVSDQPVVIEQVQDLIKTLDIPTRQVLIETMIVDALLSDDADTGVQWLMNSLHRMSRRQAALGEDGRAVGNLQELSLATDLEVLQRPGSMLAYSILSDKIDWSGLIQAEVRNRNGRMVSNPVLLTLENEPAEIAISQEVPYIELSQTNLGGSQTNTRFKDIGTLLSVTPRVTHDKTILCKIDAKESLINGQFQGVPIEDKREISSTMRLSDGQTIFIGGLRKSDQETSTRKMPVLGDVPVVNFLFRTNSRKEQINELLVFLTCSVIEKEHLELTPHQQEVLETAPPLVPDVDAWETIMHDTVHPEETKQVQMRWRRGL